MLELETIVKDNIRKYSIKTKRGIKDDWPVLAGVGVSLASFFAYESLSSWKFHPEEELVEWGHDYSSFLHMIGIPILINDIKRIREVKRTMSSEERRERRIGFLKNPAKLLVEYPGISGYLLGPFMSFGLNYTSSPSSTYKLRLIYEKVFESWRLHSLGHPESTTHFHSFIKASINLLLIGFNSGTAGGSMFFNLLSWMMGRKKDMPFIDKIKHEWYDTTHQFEKQFSLLEKVIRENPERDYSDYLADLTNRVGLFDKEIEYRRRLLNLKEKEETLQDSISIATPLLYFVEGVYNFISRGLEKLLKDGPLSVKHSEELMYVCCRLGMKKLADSVAYDFGKEHPEWADDFKGLEGLFFLEKGKTRQAREILEPLARDAVASGRYPIKQMGETVNFVYSVVGKGLIPLSIVAKVNDMRSLEEEVRLTNAADKSRVYAKNPKDFAVPFPISVFDHKEEKGIYVMTRLPGETLYKLMIDGDEHFLDWMARGAESIALFERYTHLLKSRRGKLDLDAVLRRKLEYKDFNIPPELQASVLKHMQPILNILYSRDVRRAFNQDPHLENLMGEKNKGPEKGILSRVDWEDKGYVPQVFNMINFLEYTRKLSIEQKREIIDYYLTLDSGYPDKENYRFVYLVAIPFRELCLSSAWSSLDRKTMWKYRPEAMETGIEALELAKDEFGSRYRKDLLAFEGLKKGLGEIKELVAV